jgi:hypothetical protein
VFTDPNVFAAGLWKSHPQKNEMFVRVLLSQTCNYREEKKRFVFSHYLRNVELYKRGSSTHTHTVTCGDSITGFEFRLLFKTLV